MTARNIQDPRERLGRQSKKMTGELEDSQGVMARAAVVAGKSGMLREEQGGWNRPALRAKKGSRRRIDGRRVSRTRQRSCRDDRKDAEGAETKEEKEGLQRKCECGDGGERDGAREGESHWGWHGEDSSSLLMRYPGFSLPSAPGQRVSILQDDLPGRQPSLDRGPALALLSTENSTETGCGRHMRVHLVADPGDNRLFLEAVGRLWCPANNSAVSPDRDGDQHPARVKVIARWSHVSAGFARP
ncbi:hypothetical protein PVAR5_1112 [Paecilomyces variotii No. 5]|uniref:Uncharacterized protein n=1 Tax=Byssochlamys spectabilis (strain No. 5 / NBRC 109023) TaxID=1356009 RepID=V5F925_BYSSN|nr:hypothetical protein PVAR5_1112 [Paecilomyces variotii No. 5]